MSLSSPKSRINRYKDPKVIGPGVYYSMHSLVELSVSRAQDTVENKDAMKYAIKAFDLAIGYIMHIQDNFPCMKCRVHIQEFSTKHPLDVITKKFQNDPVGATQELSIWAYDLHNNANRQANNPNENYEDVVEFFRNGGAVCNDECGGDHEETKEVHQQETKEAPKNTLSAKVVNLIKGGIPDNKVQNIAITRGYSVIGVGNLHALRL